MCTSCAESRPIPRYERGGIINEKVKVLYIEDDSDSQRLIERVLKNHGYDVHVASDGLEGVKIADKIMPRLILMDINLPHIDGRAVTTRLRSLPHLTKTPIVALTADISDGGRELALAAGCVGFLNKPIDVDKFPQQVAAFIDGRTQKLDQDSHQHHLRLHAENIVEQLEKKIRELKEANKLLFQLDRMKSDFIVLASHELYTPLTLVSGYAHLLGEQLQEDEATFSMQKAQEMSNLLNLSIERLQRVVHEIMSVARIAAGRLELSTGPVYLTRLVTGVIEKLDGTLRLRALQVDLSGLPELPLIFADGGQLETAVANILENAIKFTPDGGAIHISGRAGDTWVELAIRDTGIGIPPEKLVQIFQQFYTLGDVAHHSSSKSAFEGGGMGLGLTIAAGIIEAHDGRIWAESSGQDYDTLPGSTFFIRLPKRPAHNG